MEGFGGGGGERGYERGAGVVGFWHGFSRLDGPKVRSSSRKV